MVGERCDPCGWDRELMHLRSSSLGAARQRAHEVDEMPGVVTVCPFAHRDRAPRHAGDDAVIDGVRLGAPFEDSGRQIPRPDRQPGVVDLCGDAIAVRRRPVAGGTTVAEERSGSSLRAFVVRRLRRDSDEPGSRLACGRRRRRRFHFE